MLRKRQSAENNTHRPTASPAPAAKEAGDGSEAYVFADTDRQTVCLRGFGDLFEQEELFDMTLRVEESKFRCHRSFLAASSDYFRALLTCDMAERGQDVITITGVDSKSMDVVLRYLYTGQAAIHTDTVQNILSAANLFQLKDLKLGCASFMQKNLDTENCIGLHFFAQAHECEDLKYHAWDWITESFDRVSESPEFLELTAENLIEVIRYDDLQASEEEVFEAVLRWLDHAPEPRAQHMYDVISHVRFALIDRHFFYDRVKPHPLLQADPRVASLLDQVVMYMVLRSRWLESDMRLEPRYSADFCRVVVYTAYLDDDKKQVVQMYGQRCDEVAVRNQSSVLCHLPPTLENPAFVVTEDNSLLAAGGSSCSPEDSALYRFSQETLAFEELTHMPTPRKQCSVVQVDSAVYIVGGCDESGNLASLLRYWPSRDEWETLADMPKALRCCCATAYRGKLYVFGGESKKTGRKKVVRGRAELSRNAYCYDPREDKWSTLAEMSCARALTGCAVYRDCIYVIGGFGSITESWVRDSSPEGCLSSVEVYDPHNNTWTPGPDLPLPLCAMGVVKYYGSIYVLGGENDEDVNYSVYQLTGKGEAGSGELQWEYQDDMVTGVTETSIHSTYTVCNVSLE